MKYFAQHVVIAAVFLTVTLGEAPAARADHRHDHWGHDNWPRANWKGATGQRKIPQRSKPAAAPKLPSARIELQQLQASRGDAVRFTATGLARQEAVEVGISGAGQTFVTLGSAGADAHGRLVAEFPVPDWARARDRLMVALRRSDGSTVLSTPFSVTDRSVAIGGLTGTNTLSGWITQGTRCPVLRTEDGQSYALTGRLMLPMGRFVEVRGPERRLSQCDEGDAVIEVRALREVPPPR